MLTTIIILSVLAIPYVYTIAKIIVRKGWTFRDYFIVLRSFLISGDYQEFLDLMEMINRGRRYDDEDE